MLVDKPIASPPVPSEDTVSTVSTDSTRWDFNPPESSPPSYSSGPSSSSTTQQPLPRCNFVAINKSNNAIRGSYLVDPTMLVPSSLLPELEGDAERKNLSLYSSNGAIQVEVFLPNVVLPAKEQATLHMHSKNGHIHATIHRSSPSPPFHLHASSNNGHINIVIPRSFRGPITIITKNGSTRVSPEVATQQMMLSDINKTYRAFIGELGDYGKDTAPGEWKADELHLESKNGSVRISYDGEVIREKGLFGSFKSWFW